jgi:hypothetical protein
LVEIVWVLKLAGNGGTWVRAVVARSTALKATEATSRISELPSRIGW